MAVNISKMRRHRVITDALFVTPGDSIRDPLQGDLGLTDHDLALDHLPGDDVPTSIIDFLALIDGAARRR